MINNLKDIISHSMAFIQDDYTELWVIANKIQQENPQLTFVGLIEATKEVIRQLVDKHHVLVLDEETQEPLKLDTQEVLKLVEERFKMLDRIPDIGDGVWFTV